MRQKTSPAKLQTRETHVFFKAEAGIRGGHVTGVQTCALPISAGFTVWGVPGDEVLRGQHKLRREHLVAGHAPHGKPGRHHEHDYGPHPGSLRRRSSRELHEIGRAPCRERVALMEVVSASSVTE